MAIGIFDSGLGGLSVYKEIKKKYPKEKIIYFADSVNFPYGEKTNAEILEFSRNIVRFFLTKNVKTIIIACNTATSIALKELTKENDIKIYGIIDAVVKYIQDENISNISIIATKATINSKVYFNKLNEKVVNEIIAPDLVECVENKKIDKYDTIRKYFENIKNTNILLACTHFPLLEKDIKKMYNNISLINPAKYIVDEIEICNDFGNDIFYTSSNIEDYKKKIIEILEKEYIDVRLHKW